MSSYMRKRRMAAITYDPNFNLPKINKEIPQHRVILQEIEGLIKVFKDGHVERPQIVPNVTSKLPNELGVTSSDMVIDRYTNIWARLYVPKILCQGNKLPLLIYFHGGGFCVGSASWICYHEFLVKLASIANCVIMSVNYRLAPENRLPRAYDDGVKTIAWVRQKVLLSANEDYWWLNKVDFSSTFLVGDSAGGNIAHNVAIRLCSKFGDLKPITLKGTILIQPFFGGESRTYSEKYTAQLPRSALTLASADTYWRLALPMGANRDHPWCNPIANEGENLVNIRDIPGILVCISELDILRDWNLEFCATLNRVVGNKKLVEYVMFKGVGHAFQVLNKSQIAQERTTDLIEHIKAFISR
ncbi:probable carboxylesterase 6 [Capsicum annuum]|uniref:probable carboxylesterase 6 n=1 Tax=Capsicum annuum TaxID=4072 RepID=UPI001FB12267|nr:probable carboxylesterase 6 [Capsicum annuum]